jgi:hypothetical protein
MIFDCEFACIQVEFEKGVEMLDIFNKYVSTTSLLDDVSMSTATPPPQEQQQEEEKNKKNGSMSTASPPHQQEEQPEEIVNTDETTQMTTREINVNTVCETDETQQIDVSSCMKPPKNNVDTEETHQPSVEANYEPPKSTVDTDEQPKSTVNTEAATQVTEENTGDPQGGLI